MEGPGVDLGAGLLRGREGRHHPRGHGRVVVPIRRTAVAPCTIGIAGRFDVVHRSLQSEAVDVATIELDRLRQGERRDGVVVVEASPMDDSEESRSDILVRHEPFKAPAYSIVVKALRGRVTVRHERQQRQTGHADVVLRIPRAGGGEFFGAHGGLLGESSLPEFVVGQRACTQCSGAVVFHEAIAVPATILVLVHDQPQASGTNRPE